jgi:hypothetical protein
MLWPDQPEYLQMFSDEGPVRVKVKFQDKNCSIAERKMHWQELDRLMDQEAKSPFRHLFFDTFRYPVVRYEIDPVRNLLTIFAGAREPE